MLARIFLPWKVRHIWFTLIPTLNFLITSRLHDEIAKKGVTQLPGIQPLLRNFSPSQTIFNNVDVKKDSRESSITQVRFRRTSVELHRYNTYAVYRKTTGQ